MAALPRSKDVLSASPASRPTEESSTVIKFPTSVIQGDSPTEIEKRLTFPNENPSLPQSVQALVRFAVLSKALESEGRSVEERSKEFYRGAVEMYRMAQEAMALQLKTKIERIKEVRKLRVKARRMSIKITKLLKS